MAALRAENLRKSYGATEAVSDFSHGFDEGVVTTILGPSGSGKSTTLWMLAGLTRPDHGRVLLDGQDITHLAPEKRDFGVVFQNYALFPHLTVLQNVEFGLRVRKFTRRERRKIAGDTLELLRIAPLANRRISQISGGEQQRTALARALAFRPKVLLLDEPLSALDAKLREELRDELFGLLGQTKLTTIYVTHDQVEAMSLGNDLVIMNGGSIEQSGPPIEVYRKPGNAFVAAFLGSANVVEAQCVQQADRRVLHLPFAVINAPASVSPGKYWAVIRPEDLSAAMNGEADFSAKVESVAFLGQRLRVVATVMNLRIVADLPNETAVTGNAIHLRISAEKLYMWHEIKEAHVFFTGSSLLAPGYFYC